MSLTVKIKKRLGSFNLDVSFTSENEMLALLGASGCGKSVTLRCIAGIMTPDEGYIELDGTVFFDSGKHINLTPQNRHVGYLFQQYALFPNMTVEQNIRSAIRDRSRRGEITKRMLETFQLQNVAQQHSALLSGGQQQRAAMARILASEPRILLLDEPFSALDSFLKAQLEQDLRNTLETFRGNVIWVSHDRDEVFRNCAKICVIDSGRSQPVVTPDELFHSPRTVPAAKLSGCKNVVSAEAAGSGVFVPCWNLGLNCRSGQAGVSAIGLRAHYLRFSDTDNCENPIRCSVVRTMDNVFSTIVILRPEGSAPDAPTLRVETDKKIWSSLAGRKNITVTIAPEDILLLN